MQQQQLMTLTDSAANHIKGLMANAPNHFLVNRAIIVERSHIILAERGELIVNARQVAQGFLRLPHVRPAIDEGFQSLQCHPGINAAFDIAASRLKSHSVH